MTYVGCAHLMCTCGNTISTILIISCYCIVRRYHDQIDDILVDVMGKASDPK